ncbi:MAG: phosphodiester glycosidase family protein, partial [Selenomonas artemidis]
MKGAVFGQLSFCFETAISSLEFVMRVLKKILVLAAALMLAAASYVHAAADLTGLRSSSGTARDRIVFDLTEMPIYHANISEDG